MLNSSTDPATKARLLSTATKEAGAWLNALPLAQSWTTVLFALPSIYEWVLIWWKLTNVSVEQQWIERALLASAVELEELVGEYFNTKQPMKLFVRLWCQLGGIPSILEPVGVCREDAKKPDGMTLIPWENGQALL